VNINDSSPSIKNSERLREVVATVGKIGKPGQFIHNIIAVQMLSEGWDAINVTHIMGLRAFTSQLLCEQVVGRGLRRTSYEVDVGTGLFNAEYVNVFGIPFTFLPSEGDNKTVPPPPKPITCIEPYPSKKEYEITWPNITRIDRIYSPELMLDWKKVRPLTLKPEETSLIVELAPIIDGKPHVDRISIINIEQLGKKFRLQSSSFRIARDVFESFEPNWKGNKEYLLLQIVKVVDQFIHSDKLRIPNTVFGQELRKRVLIALNMNKIVHHIWGTITFQNVSRTTLVFDKEKPIRSTADMLPWYTTRVAEYTRKSHISHAVLDSKFEQATVFELEINPDVKSWVKNDHLGFVVAYVYQGIIHGYWPDFLVKLRNSLTLILEIKGLDTEKERTKREYLNDWVNAVNEDGRFGEWTWDIAFTQSDVRGIISKILKIRSGKE
jgi:type III restriction enzyme